MAVVARYLLDTSAAARVPAPQVADRVVPLLSAGLLATCAALDLEALYSARTPQEYRTSRRRTIPCAWSCTPASAATCGGYG